ncbi:glucosaminidase domain-containing protein [Streptococcus gallolyticus]|uniref:glucosaminidase domain-containing protein n=1 Tax=Streptococcus hepaticus TaxID=3349163 RepID=UPI001C947E65|nr:glucosaminidase domain-containing protein [Streptococcus gallolyticus]MBY5041919.1 glucosaminidase domain-containing protein [Streptococcus gallolyticus]
MANKRKKQHRSYPRKPSSSKPLFQRIKWKKILIQLGLVLAIFLALKGYQTWKIQTEQKAFEQADKTEFIQIVGNSAENIAQEHDLYASVMVAQAILESDWGQSRLTREANNLFGVKGDFEGQSYEIETQEDDGTGKLFTIVAHFRQYPTYHDSLRDNAKLLSQGVSWDRNYYAGVWKSRTQSYKEATAYLQGRYATDTNYAKKLNALIAQYHLTRFD